MIDQQKTEELTELLMAMGQAHHQAYIATDGEDPDWAVWYGNYLEEPLSNILETRLSALEITEKLLALDKEFNSAEQSQHWTSYYAERF